ncbi:MAG: hypothetical protein LBE82_13565 [Chitinophagaceae bacterium]|jgi:lysozyme family protein|nr:hypothetical protein [Chitinophagaceae bacterium]
MADFNLAYKNKIIPYEGGYDTDPNDSGNWTSGKINVGVIAGTNAGITSIDYKDYYGMVPTASQMKALTEMQRIAIWKKLYWDKINGDDIKNQRHAELIFDAQVNLGIGAAMKILAHALNMSFTPIQMNGTLLEALNDLNGRLS